MHTKPPVLPPLVVIVGPTGSGKSALGLRLAEKLNGEIISCDSLQLYRGFDVGTAKVPPADRHHIPHHLIDVLPASQRYSAGEFARDARQIIGEISARGRLPVIIGGTGFYLRALLEGLPQLPPQDRELRAGLANRESRRPGAIHRLLRRLDPTAAARIHFRDTQKALRALEVRILTGKPSPHPATAEPLQEYRTIKIGLDPDRAQLHKVLDARALEMFRHVLVQNSLVQDGLIREVQDLLSMGCSGEEKPFESLGYKQALQHVRGSITLDQAIASTQIETRQYAKRQWTWFRRDKHVIWLAGFGDEPAILERCLNLAASFLCAEGNSGDAGAYIR
jgi:tRNA dimethylallyltransferase